MLGPMKTQPPLVPLLVVQGAARAIEFYVRSLGANVLARYEHGAERRIAHAELEIGSAAFSVTEELRAWNSDAPPSLGGSPVVLQLFVDELDHVLTSMRDAGATVVFPAQELLGERMARLRDPFGHLWILRQVLEELSVAEIKRQRDELVARVASEAAATTPGRVEDPANIGQQPPVEQAVASEDLRRGRIHLVIGPVGSGKSTFATGLARDHGAIRLTLDAWMVRLFTPDRPDTGVIEWYVERAARCVEVTWTVAQSAVDVGTDVVLEIGLLQRRERERFYQRAADLGVPVSITVVDADRDVRRQRVEERNRTPGPTFSMVVPPAIFEMASDLWEPPEPEEREGRDMRFVRT